ncbi:transcriptional adapter 3-B-like isoform X2 [Babylonia areolata]|uniref:transcriptional adapter 3-B-like isoform X2 n=1 Tax=Babylonia areolata TaxID=304850 RepID=UPI003FD49518
MKGKGKTAQQQQQQQEKDCPLQFPDLSIVNHEEECKRYTAILGRSPTETISIEELDTVQTDLEVLLASVGRRLKLLKSETQILQNWQEKKDVKTPLIKGKVSEPPTATKRGKGASSSTPEERPSKKFKESSGKAAPAPSSVASPVARSKSKLPQMKSEGEAVNSAAELPRVVKNECVDRFWQAMENYCRPITDEDVKYLEEQVQKVEDEESTYFKIPPLGRHYREVWAEEDLLEEMAEGSKVNDKKRHSNHTNHTYPGATANGSNGTTDPSLLLRKAENSMEDSPIGPLTQRLVSALLEENIMTPMEDIITDFGENLEEAPAISPRALAKQLNITNPATLERRIQRELEEQGILEPEEEVEDDPSDEILTELKQAQANLKPLLQWKSQHLKDLAKKARERQAWQQLWKKYEECDAKLQEEYRKLNAARQKKKPSLKRERESVKKVMKEWWAIHQALDESYNQ